MISSTLETLKGILTDAPEPLLNFYINKATNYFLATTNLLEVPENASFLIIDLTIIYYNKFGNEGIISSSQSGININWGNDIPNDTKRAFAKFRSISW